MHLNVNQYIKLLDAANITNNYYNVIYRIKNDLNEHCYIGQTISFKRRMKEHIKGMHAKNTDQWQIYNAFRKYGLHNFSVAVIEEIVNLKDMSSRETFYIQHYDTFKNGYNMTPAATSGHPKAIQQICSKTGVLIAEFSSISEACEKTGIHNISEGLCGKIKHPGKQPFIWKFVDEKQESVGRWSQEAKDRMSKRVLADETIYTPVIQLSFPDMVEITRYPSIQEATKQTGVKLISACCRRVKPQAGGFVWRYADENLNARYLSSKWTDEKVKKHKPQNANVKIEQIDLKTNTIIRVFKNHKEASETTGIGHIYAVCLGHRKSAGGFGWRYSE